MTVQVESPWLSEYETLVSTSLFISIFAESSAQKNKTAVISPDEKKKVERNCSIRKTDRKTAKKILLEAIHIHGYVAHT